MIPRASNKSGWAVAAFSLVEVVVALGICAITVTSVLAFIGPVASTIGAVRDAHAAARVMSAVQTELQELPFSTVSSYLANGDLLYSSRGGERMGTYLAPVWNDLGAAQLDRDRGKFFEILLIPNNTLSPVPGALVFTMRLRWPAYAADGQPVTNDASKTVLLVAAAVAR